MGNEQTRDVTQLLRRLSAGDRSAESELLPLVYAELKRFAAAQLRNQRQGHTLQATALVHEVYLRLTNVQLAAWNDRLHFFAVAARLMRRILVDHARRRDADKRGGLAMKITFDDALQVSNEQCDLIEHLDEALERLSKIHPRKADIVDLRFFAGLTEEEIGKLLGISPRTVKRDWMTARLAIRRTDQVVLSHKYFRMR